MSAGSALVRLPAPVLVLGAYGYRNIGDEAILAGLLAQLGEDADPSVVSRMPAETAALHGVRSVGPAAALGALRNHRSLLIGGGGLFGSGMGRLGRMTALFGLAASALGRRVAVVGVGVDPDLPLATAWPLRRLADRKSVV